MPISSDITQIGPPVVKLPQNCWFHKLLILNGLRLHNIRQRLLDIFAETFVIFQCPLTLLFLACYIFAWIQQLLMLVICLVPAYNQNKLDLLYSSV